METVIKGPGVAHSELGLVVVGQNPFREQFPQDFLPFELPQVGVHGADSVPVIIADDGVDGPAGDIVEDDRLQEELPVRERLCLETL